MGGSASPVRPEYTICSLEDVQYCGGIPSVYWKDAITHQLCGRFSALWRDTISTVWDAFSAVEGPFFFSPLFPLFSLLFQQLIFAKLFPCVLGKICLVKEKIVPPTGMRWGQFTKDIFFPPYGGKHREMCHEGHLLYD